MKTRILILLLAAIPLYANAVSNHAVRGYYRKNGTFVSPHRQTNPNKTRRDNWSSKGNVNPYTGKAGTKDASK